MVELVDIIDDLDKVIDVVPRPQMRALKLPHRSTYIAYLTCDNKFLIEIRTLNKDYAPGKLDACIGGVVAHGESPLEGAKRELLEEVGIKSDEIKYYELGKMYVKLPHSFFYAYMSLAIGNKISIRQDSEVSGIMYLDYDNIMALEHNFTSDSIIVLKEIVSRARSLDLL